VNTIKLKGIWNEAAGKFKQQFANLTDYDLLFQKKKKKNYWEDCRINLVKPRKNYAK
jgi:hypothetical protein